MKIRKRQPNLKISLDEAMIRHGAVERMPDSREQFIERTMLTRALQLATSKTNDDPTNPTLVGAVFDAQAKLSQFVSDVRTMKYALYDADTFGQRYCPPQGDTHEVP